MSSKIAFTQWNPACIPNTAHGSLIISQISPREVKRTQPEQLDDQPSLQNFTRKSLDDSNETISEKTITRRNMDDKVEHVEPLNLHMTEASLENHEVNRAEQKCQERSHCKQSSTISFTRTIPDDVTWTEDETNPDCNLKNTDKNAFESMTNPDPTALFSQTLAQGDIEEHSFVKSFSEFDHLAEQGPRHLFEGNEIDHTAVSLTENTSISPRQDNRTVQENPLVVSRPHDTRNAHDGQTLDELLSNTASKSEDWLHPLDPKQPPPGPTSSSPTNFSENSDHLHEALNNQEDPQESLGELAMQMSKTFGDDQKEQAQILIPGPCDKTQIFQENTIISSTANLDATAFPTIQPNENETLEIIENSKIELSDNDLAAKWREALCDDAADCLLDDDDNDEHVVSAKPKKEIDPAALFDSDDDGFLDDADENLIDTHTYETSILSQSQASDMSFRRSTDRSQPTGLVGNSNNHYMPVDTTIADPILQYNNQVAAPNFNEYVNYSAASVSNFQPPQTRQCQEISKAKSFANLSKGGYSSPYDFPTDVVPKKRVSVQLLNRPASSYLNSIPGRVSAYPSATPAASKSVRSEQTSSSNHNRSTSTGETPQAGFFEELPIPLKPKLAPRRSSAHNTPSQYQIPQRSASYQQSIALIPESQMLPQIPQYPTQPPQSQLNQALITPERVSPYSPLPTTNAMVSPPSTQSKTATLQNPSQPSHPPAAHTETRQYAPNYIASSAVSACMRSHHPRTSSPLAHFERSQNTPKTSVHSRKISADHQKRLAGFESTMHSHSPTKEDNEADSASLLHTLMPILPTSPSLTNIPPPQSYISNSLQNYNSNPIPLTPQRPRTQSPKSALISSKQGVVKNEYYQRSASVEPPNFIPSSATAYALANTNPSQKMLGELRQAIDYLAPNDGREHDPLQRWKGSPIFAWGVGGSIVCSFPKSLPLYGMNQLSPMLQRHPGEVRIQRIKDVNPLSPLISSFPGPLRGKSKKKEVVAWLKSGIDILESIVANPRLNNQISYDDKRLEERILLWKILRIFIEYDGILEGSPEVQKAVKATLSPGIYEEDVVNANFLATGAELMGISDSKIPTTRADAVDPLTVDVLKKLLFQGDREKAVWEAVDKRLWAHALLISNTVSKDLYKQVTQEFVQKEVRTIGDNTQSLAVLYEIFAGSFEESIDELVPPSARAGFQMVSTSNEGGSSKDALMGLDKWRETLSFVLSNRNPEDTRALIALGKLLAGYGRSEASHICFLFARNQILFSGIDDTLTNVVLFGSDHLKQPQEFDRELEPILLSEVFDYGMSLVNQATTAISSPHLAVYKLQYAKLLAENGFQEKALKYCEAIAASTTNQTRRSPYHHTQLISEVEDLSQRLRQSPKDESGSWISKPSIDKAKGSVWATFNKFVAGEESNAGENASNLSIPTEGPFSKFVGGESTISHLPSSVELSNSYISATSMSNNSIPTVETVGSRYTPVCTFPTRNQELRTSSSQGSQKRPSLGSRSTSEYNRYEPRQNVSSTVDIHRHHIPQNVNSDCIRPPQTISEVSQLSHGPYGMNNPTNEAGPLIQESPVNEPSIQTLDDSEASKITVSYPDLKSYSPHPPDQAQGPSVGYEVLTSNDYESHTSIYKPLLETIDDEPSSPSENLAEQNSFENSGVGNKPNETFIIPREKSRAEKDDEANEAFRRAAEADAQKTKESAPSKKGWGIASWFIGSAKKKPDEKSSPNKPIRAKLGEASSFVYDTELKRWVNNKATTDQAETKRLISPPPRTVGPPRSENTTSQAPNDPPEVLVSNSGNRPPLGNRASNDRIVDTANQEKNCDINPPVTVKGATDATRQLPPISQSLTRTTSSSSILPPSRPGTSMSNASSIDDLLGPPSLTRRSGAKLKKKGRGYIDVMGEAVAS